MPLQSRLVLAAFIALYPTNALAAAHHFCFRFGVAPQDAGVGEDFGTNPTDQWIARGVKVKVYRGGASQFEGFASKDTGCIDFTSGHTTDFDITVYAYTKLSFNETFHLRAWDHKSQYDTWYANQTPSNLQKWLFEDKDPTCAGTCNLTVATSPNTDAVANMLAFATFQVYRTESESSYGLSVGGADPDVHLINDDCGGPGGGSCQVNNILYIRSPDGQRRKFLVGHEVGHWLHWLYLDRSQIYAGLPDVYNPLAIADGQHPACNSDTAPGYTHMMRSIEYQGGAFAEGFAHFLSTFAYNDHGEDDAMFKYYKAWGLLYNYDTINVEDGGAFNGGYTDFHSNGCGCNASDNSCEDYGVELDWLRHYWDYATNSDYCTSPNISSILQHSEDAYDANGGYDRDDVQSQLEAELFGSGCLRSEWDSLADFNGIDPTPEVG